MPRWAARAVSSSKTLLLSLLGMLTVQTVISTIWRFAQPVQTLFAGAGNDAPPTGKHAESMSCRMSNRSVDLNWYPPVKWDVNSLDQAINGTGTYGFIFNSSQGPLNAYNWCNMPHVNPATYVEVDSSYELQYVEVIHRHHKRTPYASNAFPHEGYSWNCDEEGLFLGGKPINPCGNSSASTYWRVYTSPSNPLAPTGFNGTCQFPQITREGLVDGHRHGVDLRDVYGGVLGFLPGYRDRSLVVYRVTNNIITSQVASMVIAGMYPETAGQNSPLLIQPASIDSLEPSYSCPAASTLLKSYGPGSRSPDWMEHLTASAELYRRLDTLSGVDPTSNDWHKSWDHYFDNLSSRLCHQRPLPCNINNPAECVSMEEAEKAFRLGEYEYSFIYRDSPLSLEASVGSYGIWVAELAQHLRCAMGNESSVPNESSGKVRYRHNIAHDGSISRLLSILQVERMVWPGMGAEIVFELYSKDGCYFLRVLWGGQVMTSSNPSLARLDLVPVANLLDYIDGLVGTGARKIPGLCQI